MIKSKSPQSAFTIVELLVVIVIIGILAAITIVSYTGITQKAVAASLQADLTNASQKLKIFQLREDNPGGNFPATIDCTIPDSSTNLCLKTSGNASYTYSADNTTTPKTFSLTETKDATVYRITNDSNPVAITTSTPTLTAPTAANITFTGATVSANITSNGGSAITERGFCWGASANPTTNCTANLAGSLGKIDSVSVSAGISADDIITSPDGKFVYMAGMNNGTWESSIFTYSRDINTGVLTSTGSISSGLYDHLKMAMSADGTSLYLIDTMEVIAIFNRNNTTGALTSAGNVMGWQIGLMMAGFRGIAVSPDGLSVYITDGMMQQLVVLNRNVTDGSLSLATTISGLDNPDEVTVSADNKSVYVLDLNQGTNRVHMYSRNITNGALTGVGSVVTQGSGWSRSQGIVVSADGKSVYTTNHSANTVSILDRDANTSLLTNSAGTIATGNGAGDVIVSPDNNSVYVSNDVEGSMSVYNRNTTNGTLTNVETKTVGAPGRMSIPGDGSSVYAISSANSIYMGHRDTGVSSLGIIKKDIGGITPGTLIHYRGYATNSIGTSYTADATFTTNP